jgi:hypothetical protein
MRIWRALVDAGYPVATDARFGPACSSAEWACTACPPARFVAHRERHLADDFNA